MFWPVLPHLLTQGDEVAVYGHETTPEVEYVLFTWRDELYVTLGNDQCDIAVEAHGWSERSKNLCQKTVARQAWPVVDVLPHWDELELTLTCNGDLLQQDMLSALIEPHTLLEKVSAADGPQNGGRMVFSGTIATKGQLPNPPYDVAMRIAIPCETVRSHMRSVSRRSRRCMGRHRDHPTESRSLPDTCRNSSNRWARPASASGVMAEIGMRRRPSER